MSQGIGFKLKDPLDRATFVDVIVNHQVRAKPVRETFQRAAIFINENHAFKQPDNTAQIFKTEFPYVVGADQLEVWVDGIRLVPKLEFVEMVDEKTPALESDMKENSIMSFYYKVMRPLSPGQLVNYRISKYVWSYDQVAQLLGSTTEDLADLKAQCKTLAQDLSNTNAHVAHQLDNLAKTIENIQGGGASIGAVAAMESGSVTTEHLSKDLREKLLGGNIFDTFMPATAMEYIPNAAKHDFIQVHLISANESRILIKNIDYTLEDTKNGLRIDLSSEYAISGNTIYVTGFQIGG